MRMRVSTTVLVIAAGLSVSPAAWADTPVVNFDMEAYAELGLVIEEVRSGYEELELAETNLSASLEYSSLVTQTLSNTGFLPLTTSFAGQLASLAAMFADTLNIISDTTPAATLQDVIDAMSPVDASSVQTWMGQLQSQLFAVNAQTQEPIPELSLYSIYAVVVSCRARTGVEAMLDDAFAGRDSALAALNNAGEHEATLEDLADRASEAANLAYALQGPVAELMENPLTVFVARDLMMGLLLMEAQFRELNRECGRMISELQRTYVRLSQRIGELDSLIVSLQWVLSAPSLPSSWVTSADTGAANAYFNLAFTGHSFNYPCTEIEGAFYLGTLNITNFITPGQGGTSLQAEVVFNVERYVNDPLLGLVHTPSSVAMHMTYTATPNDPEDNCGTSRDYFTIPSLGIETHICEEDTQGFEIWARYDSPLRIVEVIAVPNSNDPDPPVVHFAYGLDVIGGSGSGVFQEGELVMIEAGSPPPGRHFLRWDGDTEFLDDFFAPMTLVAMPSQRVTVQAVFEPIPIQHSLVVHNGFGSGLYNEQSWVSIEADVPDGYQFIGWLGDTFAVLDPNAAATDVYMAQNVTISAATGPRDDCPDDPYKTEPGTCGCGTADIDSDGDGILDCIDGCPDSNFAPTVVLGGIDSTVANRVVGGGCTMADMLAKAAAGAGNHGQFVSMVAHLTNGWRNSGLITAQERAKLQRTAARASIP